MSESVGIMDPAYFVNKNEILKWINTTLKLNVEKIDHLGAGSVYCQFLDMIYPGSVCMGKVNWKAKLEYEYLSNFKIVTSCLEKHDIKRYVDVNKLVKCKYQDNLEFAQWFKKFFDTKCGDRNSDYDAEARRGVKLSTIVDVPKVARKEEQAKQKTVTASLGNHSSTNSTTATTSTTANKDKKVNTPSKPANSINTKRPISALHATTTTGASKIANGHASKIAPSKSSATTKTAANVAGESKEYSSLINSIKDILSKSESDQDIVNKIRSLVKVDATTAQGKENQAATLNNSSIKQTQSTIQTNETTVLQDTTNTSSSVIEQEVQ